MVARATTAKRSHKQQPKRRDDEPKARSHQPDHGERDQHHRDRQAGGDGEQHHVVDAPAEETAEHAERDADQAGREHRHDADQQRDARAIDQPREIVAPELIGAERMLGPAAVHPERRHQTLAEVLHERILRHERIADERSRRDQGDDGNAEREARLADARRLRRLNGGNSRGAHAALSLGSSNALRMSASKVRPI